MRKLKLQMQISADGFIAGPEGERTVAAEKTDYLEVAFARIMRDTPKIVFSKTRDRVTWKKLMNSISSSTRLRLELA